MSQIILKIARQVEKKLSELLPDDCRSLIIALSGGGDSLALAHVLLSICRKKGLKLHAYHLNHGLRGEESDQDQRFVENWCNENKLPLKSEKITSLIEFQKQHGFSLEEAAREYRYRKLVEYANEINADAIVTGHTLDDDIETFLLRCVTGASLNALAGISEKTKFEEIPVIRPLLTITRNELREYLKDSNELWREDSTNLETDTFRNLVRLEIIPFMEKVFDRDVHSAIGRTVLNLKRERDMLDEFLKTEILFSNLWIPLDTPWKIGFLIEAAELSQLGKALRYRALMWALDRLELPIKRRKADIFKLMDDFISLKGGKKHHHLGDGVYLARSGSVIITAKFKEKCSLDFDLLSADSGLYIEEMMKMIDSRVTTISKDGTYSLGDIEITVETVDRTDIKDRVSKGGGKTVEYFDPSLLDGGIELVYGGAITGSESKKDENDSEFRPIGNRVLVDQWVRWPVLKKQDEIVWIVGVCKKSRYDQISGNKVLKISANMPDDFELFTR